MSIKREKPALESYDVWKMTLKPASCILSELQHLGEEGKGYSVEREWTGIGDLAMWLF